MSVPNRPFQVLAANYRLTHCAYPPSELDSETDNRFNSKNVEKGLIFRNTTTCLQPYHY